MLILMGSLLFSLPQASGQQSLASQRSKQQGVLLQALKKAASRIPASHQQYLSAHARNIIHMAQTWNAQRLERMQALGTQNLTHNPEGGITPNLGAPLPEVAATTVGPVLVSDPTADYKLSVSAGFTQNETSSAWCGNSILVGYNDSGSWLESTQAAT